MQCGGDRGESELRVKMKHRIEGAFIGFFLAAATGFAFMYIGALMRGEPFAFFVLLVAGAVIGAIMEAKE
jgi:hypothetical protein